MRHGNGFGGVPNAAGRRPSRPRVVLVDPDHWDALELFAPSVRRHGLDVVRLIEDPGGISMPARVLDRIMFGARQGALPHRREGRAGEISGWLAPPTVDVQGPEDPVESLRAAGGWPSHAAAQRVPYAQHVALLYDKRSMSDFAGNLGLCIPEAWDEPPAGRFPIVVKGRHGSGGQRVRVVGDPYELQAAVAQIDPQGSGTVFFQEFESGPVETFGGVARAGRIVAGGEYRTLPGVHSPMGPAERIEIVESRSVHDQVASLVAALEYTGFLCVDFVVRPDGTAALIDFNPRVFGSWLALQEAGIDLIGAYLSLFGLGEPMVQPTMPAGSVRRVRHIPRSDIGDWREWRLEVRESARSLLAASRTTGRSYLFVGGVRAALRLGVAGVGMIRRGR